MPEIITEIHSENKKLSLVKEGRGEAVILLHGYPENHQVFFRLIPALSKTKQLIAFDWPGMGNSDEWKGGATPLHMAKRLAALMDDWKIEKAHLIAQDMGGQPALVFAAEFPSRVISLVVMNSLVGAEIQTSWEIKLLRKFSINNLLLKYFPGLVFYRALHTFLVSASALPDPERSAMQNAFNNPAVRNFIIRMCAGYEAQLPRLPEWYAKVKCPLLILWGEKDRHFPPAQAYYLKEKIPHAKLEIIKGGGHWMVVDRSAEVLDKINEFYVDLNNSVNTLS
jgi:2-hydroxymuconate-semialdehyde hydrolase